MRSNEFLIEGGWDSTVTQGTVIKPRCGQDCTGCGATVCCKTSTNILNSQTTLHLLQWAGLQASSAHHEADTKQTIPDKVYGDIDLQMIAPPEIEGMPVTDSLPVYWNGLADEFVKAQTSWLCTSG
jgi:hypothetical protein